jgi:ribosomal protein L30/L7E
MSTIIDIRTCLKPNGFTTLNTLNLSVRFHGAILHDTPLESIVSLSVY